MAAWALKSSDDCAGDEFSQADCGTELMLSAEKSDSSSWCVVAAALSARALEHADGALPHSTARPTSGFGTAEALAAWARKASDDYADDRFSRADCGAELTLFSEKSDGSSWRAIAAALGARALEHADGVLSHVCD